MNYIDVNISDQVLSLDHCYNFILTDECGGNAIFVGTTRNINKGEKVTYLDFETYETMARKVMNAIALEAIDDYQVNRVAVHHRKGRVQIKDIAVIIAVSARHRDGAFKACRYIIDQLKERVPIWKKEYLENGSYWVNARP